jgi:hypothetical protein
VSGQRLRQRASEGDRPTEGLYVPHIRKIGEEKLDDAQEKRYPARRWVVERTLGWLSKCRAILVRYDKKAAKPTWGSDQGGLHPAVVSASAPFIPFEIVC